jgi:hypothetical protein
MIVAIAPPPPTEANTLPELAISMAVVLALVAAVVVITIVYRYKRQT